MDRIEHPTAVENRPAYEVLPNSKKGFAEGFNPTTKSKGTENVAAQYNAIQETLMNVIETAGLVGNHADDSLLTKAIKALINRKGDIEDHLHYGGAIGSDFVENTLVWKGYARSSENTEDIIIDDYIRSEPLPADIVPGVYYGFVGYDSEQNVKFEFADKKHQPTLSTINNVYRRVCSVIVDNTKNIVPSNYKVYKDGSLKSTMHNRLNINSNGAASNGDLYDSIAPIDTDIEVSIFASKSTSGVVMGVLESSSHSIEIPTVPYQADVVASASIVGSPSIINKNIENKSGQLKLTSSGTFTDFDIGLISYKDERVD